MLHQLILASLFSVSLFIATAHTDVKYEAVVQDTATTTESVSESLPDANKAILRPELEKICACESGNGTPGTARQFYEDGSVVRGKVDPLDTGKCQISKRYWLDMSDKLGYDIETDEGNTLMANWIYDNYGTEPWKWSKSCWNK